MGSSMTGTEKKAISTRKSCSLPWPENTWPCGSVGQSVGVGVGGERGWLKVTDDGEKRVDVTDEIDYLDKQRLELLVLA